MMDTDTPGFCICRGQHALPSYFECKPPLDTGCDECHELSILDEKIMKARRRLADLIDRRRAHYFAMNDKHDRLRQRLPLELYSKVFEFSIQPGKSTWPPGPRPHERTTASLLTRVCKGWKETLHAMPHLWTSLEIYVDHLDAEHADGREVLSRIFSRSRIFPLSLWLYSKEPLVSAKAESVLLSLSSHSKRLKRLYLYGPEGLLDHILSIAAEGKLQRYPFILQCLGYRNNSEMFINFLSESPRLLHPSTLTIHRWLPNPFPIQTNCLTDVTCYEFRSANRISGSYISLLQLCPVIKKLTIYDYYGHEDHGRRQVFTHSNLKILEIIFRKPCKQHVYLMPFFGNLRLPALTTLKLNIPSDWADRKQMFCVHFHGMDAFLERSGCSLSSLTLLQCDVVWHIEDDAISCFRLQDMQGLRELVLSEAYSGFDLTRNMFKTFASTPSLLPELTDLTLIGSAALIDMQDLLAFISPECHPSLRRLEVVGGATDELCAAFKMRSTEEENVSYDFHFEAAVLEFKIGGLFIRVVGASQGVQRFVQPDF